MSSTAPSCPATSVCPAPGPKRSPSGARRPSTPETRCSRCGPGSSPEPPLAGRTLLQDGDEPLGGDHAIGVLADARHLVPVEVDIETQPQPSPSPAVG